MPITGDMTLDQALSKIRKLIAVAEDPATDQKVAESYQQMADALMLTYSIQEITAEQAKPAEQRTKPIIIKVDVGLIQSEIIGYQGTFTRNIAAHCRCRVRLWSGWHDNTWEAKVYGFESDVRYFEILYTSLRLHMLGVLIPKIESHRSLEDNCYYLHNAGWNWLEMGEMYGWHKYNPYDTGDREHYGVREPYRNERTGEVKTKFQVGGIFKRAYYKACAARGEQPTIIAAGGTEGYRKDAASGYVTRLAQRLDRIASGREAGAEIVLRSRFEDLDALFRQDNPDLFKKQEPRPQCEKCKAAKSGFCREHKPAPIRYHTRKFNSAAYQQGVSHADTANINVNVGGTPRRELG